MKESEIRPQSLMLQYVELSAKDAERYFIQGERYDIPCIACASDDVISQFTKYGFGYALCAQCGSLYQTPRPSIGSFEAFYRDSESSRYWAEVFYPSVAEARREKIFKPRARRLASLCDQIGIEVHKMVDVGAGYGIFLDEWRKVRPATELLAVEPSSMLSQQCRQLGFNVVEELVENITGYDNYADLVVCFEVLEHVYQPMEFINVLKRMVRPGGYILVSTLCIDGFDLQVLWDKSSQISPPHHINFHSLEGFECLFKRAGLTDIVITTPGQLDVDIVRNHLQKDPDMARHNRFLQKLLGNKTKSDAFQQFLVENHLSSHAWVFGKKCEGES